MKDQPTSEQISKLPKWAQAHIIDCQRERDEANKILQSAMDEQKESPFYTQEFRGTEPAIGSRFVKRYFQARNISVEHEGINLNVMLPCGVQGREGIEVSWEATGHISSHVSMIPQSFQKVSLFAVRKQTENYQELLYAVSKKFPDETRHETALRYIQERENLSGDPAQEIKENK